MARRWWMAGAAAVAALAVGCTSASETGSGSPSTAIESSGACGLEDGDTSTASLLRFVADDDLNRSYVSVADLGAFLDHQDATLPDDFRNVTWGGDNSSLFTPTGHLQLAIQSLDGDGDVDALAQEYGIGIGQVQRAVTFGEPPAATDLLVGSFDPAAVDAAVRADQRWSDELVEEQRNGVTFYAWGEDDELRPDGLSPMRNLGIGGRMWSGDQVAAFTRSTAPMEQLLAACTGQQPSLADDEVYVGIAERLDGLDGAFHLTITDQLGDGGGGAPQRRGTDPRGSMPSQDGEALEGVVAYGFASAPPDGGDQARIRLVIAHEDDEAARANEQRFADHVATASSVVRGEPWAERLRIEDDVVDGRFLVVDLEADVINVIDQNLFSRDNLLVTEG